MAKFNVTVNVTEVLADDVRGQENVRGISVARAVEAESEGAALTTIAEIFKDVK